MLGYVNNYSEIEHIMIERKLIPSWANQKFEIHKEEKLGIFISSANLLKFAAIRKHVTVFLIDTLENVLIIDNVLQNSSGLED